MLAVDLCSIDPENLANAALRLRLRVSNQIRFFPHDGSLIYSHSRLQTGPGPWFEPSPSRSMAV